MIALRFTLVLVLAAVLDLSTPLVSPAMEGFEESQEAVRRSQVRPLFRLMRDASAPSQADPKGQSSVQRVPPVTWNPRSRLVIGAWARKVPTSVPDSPPASEDH